MTEDVSKKTVDVTTLDQHPREGREQEIVEGKRNSRAKQSWLSGVKSSEKEEMGKEESETEVAVDCCSVALKTGHQGEDREREGETDARE